MAKRDFDNFYRTTYAAFFYYALHLLNDEEQSRDVVGEAMTELWTHADQWALADWKRNLYRFIHSRCIDLTLTNSIMTLTNSINEALPRC